MTPNPETRTKLDTSLGELRAVRKLERVASSIRTFLAGQIEKIDEAIKAIDEVNRQQQTFRQEWETFEQKKRDWKKTQSIESDRLYEAGQKLIQAWEQLEAQRVELPAVPESPSTNDNS